MCNVGYVCHTIVWARLSLQIRTIINEKILRKIFYNDYNVHCIVLFVHKVNRMRAQTQTHTNIFLGLNIEIVKTEMSHIDACV